MERIPAQPNQAEAINVSLYENVLNLVEAAQSPGAACAAIDTNGAALYESTDFLYKELRNQVRLGYGADQDKLAQFSRQRDEVNNLRDLAGHLEQAQTVSQGLAFYAAEKLAPLQRYEPLKNLPEPKKSKNAHILGDLLSATAQRAGKMASKAANISLEKSSNAINRTAEVIKNKLAPEKVKIAGRVALASTVLLAGVGANLIKSSEHSPIKSRQATATTQTIEPQQMAEPSTQADKEQVVVQPGSTLSELARSHNTTVEQILRANPDNIKDPAHINPGQVLELPKTGLAPTTTPVTTTPTVPETVPAPSLSPEQQALKNGSTEKLSSILAERILNHPNIIIQGSENGRVRNSIETAANNHGHTFLYNQDSGKDVDVNPLVLKTVLDLADNGIQLSLNSLTTCTCHKPNSDHYSGNAADIMPIDLSNRPKIKEMLQQQPFVKQVLDEGNHLHFAKNRAPLDELQKIFDVPEAPPAPPQVKDQPSPVPEKKGPNLDNIQPINGVDPALIKEALAYLIDNHGLAPEKAAMLVGDFITEADLNPGAPGGGLAQLQGERREGMPSGLREQIDFLLNTEMERSGNVQLKALLQDSNAKLEDIKQAILDWEKPGIVGHRFEFGQEISNEISA